MFKLGGVNLKIFHFECRSSKRGGYPSLKLTASSHLKIRSLNDDTIFLGFGLFSGAMSVLERVYIYI